MYLTNVYEINHFKYHLSLLSFNLIKNEYPLDEHNTKIIDTFCLMSNDLYSVVNQSEMAASFQLGWKKQNT